MELQVIRVISKMETTIMKIVLSPTEKNGASSLAPMAADFSWVDRVENSIPSLCCLTPPGADRTSLLRVYQSIVLSRRDYGCAIYGSACYSALKKLDPVHHMALRIFSGAFRTSPVQSHYVDFNQLSLDLRCRKLSLA
ncbi:putative RNA-directed DNA polymerase from transposon X-element [Trichonephila clavipes]|nr:putative RNA-directed DNA polymerase from transposon X-element [Trichonephila clavipes]